MQYAPRVCTLVLFILILPNALRQPLSCYEQQTLTHLLKTYRGGQCGDPDSLLFGDEVASGNQDNAISAIVKTAETINSPRHIAQLGIVNVTQCRQMYGIVNSCIDEYYATCVSYSHH